MTIGLPTSFKDLMWMQKCIYCGAKSKEACKTKTGHKTAPHAARYYAAKAVQATEALRNE
jgi:hypothetical protein